MEKLKSNYMGQRDKKEEERVFSYISEISEELAKKDIGILTDKEVNFIISAYYIVKDNYSKEQYIDIVQNSCATILRYKNSGLSNRDLFHKILNDIYTNIPSTVKEDMGLESVSVNYDYTKKKFDASEQLRDILALFDMDAMDRVKDDIFIRVIKGEDVKELALMYHTTAENIDNICTEKLSIVDSIRVKDGIIYVDGMENYSKRLEDKLRFVQDNLLGKNYIKSREDIK